VRTRSVRNIYGTTDQGGPYDMGTVFELTPVNGGGFYTDLHDFTGGEDGWAPAGSVLLDAAGNIYGTASIGGADNHGVVWEITP
jgi:uncharacterized repeat protein (TIGR03803 family)